MWYLHVDASSDQKPVWNFLHHFGHRVNVNVWLCTLTSAQWNRNHVHYCMLAAVTFNTPSGSIDSICVIISAVEASFTRWGQWLNTMDCRKVI